MTLKIFHQVGHNANWNLDSMEQDGAGDGLILSPVHQPKHSIGNVSAEARGRSFFDPQFYLPSSKKKKLQTYSFFPENISGGFSTVDFSAHAFDAAVDCIDFQVEMGFDRLVIPARFFSQMVSDYQQQQEAYTLKPFLEYIRTLSVDKPVFMTLPLTSHMVADVKYREELLNWVTRFPEIHGVYAFVDNERDTKQVRDSDYLYESLAFFKSIVNADLELVIGYTNTEALLFSLLGDITLTFGTFENTRIFSIDKFLESDEGRRGPKARIYLPGLMNWVQYTQAKEIQRDLPEVWDGVYRSTSYGDAALASVTEPTFNQPGLYKHFFLVMYDQIKTLRAMSIVDRYGYLRAALKTAESSYAVIERGRIDLEVHGAGGHIQPWLSAINRYARGFL
ncbi:hypothetical protein KO528_17475 [Saccharophagus degradans]|uniref:hypothetical protein n=1 Tax=Saccharophagus degradans TaxID=86304 RepID=UPI001C09ABAA|nr:hypothetical protein [Saccharophagus degradans]MBU2987161.1 hypothetical protein [Saccharophagus degradans]